MPVAPVDADAVVPRRRQGIGVGEVGHHAVEGRAEVGNERGARRRERGVADDLVVDDLAGAGLAVAHALGRQLGGGIVDGPARDVALVGDNVSHAVDRGGKRGGGKRVKCVFMIDWIARRR